MGNKNNNNDFPFGWLDFGSSIAGVAANVLSTILTNKKNEKLTRLQNAFQKQENELAYQRAKPQNQVAQMMQAGMSKAGALNAINGGATYQPAPISAATAQAPEIDLSTAFDGLMQIGENAKQRDLQEKLLSKQIKAAEDAQKAQFEENEKQRKHDVLMKDVDTANQIQHDYLEYEKHKEQLAFQKENARHNWRLIDRQIANMSTQNELLKREIKGVELDNLRKELENANYPELAKLTNQKLFNEIQRLVLDYNHAVENHELDKKGKELANRLEELTQNARINAENARNQLNAYMDNVHLSTNSPAGGIFATLELFMNNFMPAIVKFK